MSEEFTGLERPEVRRFMRAAQDWSSEEIDTAITLLGMLNEGMPLREVIQFGKTEIQRHDAQEGSL